MLATTPDLVESLYERWGAAFAAEPEMPLDRWRAMIAEWPQVMAEPGGVDYLQASDAEIADDAIRRLAGWVRPHLGL